VEHENKDKLMDETFEGYTDGLDMNNPEPSKNRSHSYRHGFANARDDKRGEPRAPAYILRAAHIAALEKDNVF